MLWLSPAGHAVESVCRDPSPSRHTIRAGDFIRLETGQEGVVEEISWRTTRIRMAPNNMVIVPNSKLSQSVVTNYALPDPRTVLPIPVSVSYESDPELVERVLLHELHKRIFRRLRQEGIEMPYPTRTVYLKNPGASAGG